VKTRGSPRTAPVATTTASDRAGRGATRLLANANACARVLRFFYADVTLYRQVWTGPVGAAVG
jgi:hypothetical protein